MARFVISSIVRASAFAGALGAVFFSCALPAAAVTPEVVTINSNGVLFTSTVPMRIEPNPASAVASVVLMTGGNGLLSLDANGIPTNSSGNFLIRTANEYLSRGINVMMVDGAPTYPSGMNYSDRLSSAHRAQMADAVNKAFLRWSMPVWLVGTSNGSISAVTGGTSAAAAGGNMPNLTGVILTSSVTEMVLGGGTTANQTTYNSYAQTITKPTLVMWNEADACIVSPPRSGVIGGSQGLFSLIAATQKGALPIRGGHSVLTDLCGAFSWHGYAGVEATAVAGIVGFIRSKSGLPADGIAVSGPGIQVEQTMPGLTEAPGFGGAGRNTRPIH